MLTLNDPGYDVWRRFNDGHHDLGPHPVVSRWRRVSELRALAPSAALDATRKDKTFRERQLRAASHFVRGHNLLRAGADELSRRGCALLLADQDGVLIASRGLNKLGDPSLLASFPEGARWDELTRGTNAIGTALAEDAPVAVIGRAHSDAEQQRFVCYAAPIHDMDGRILAVLDATGPVQAADPLMVARNVS
jgi:sigma-54 dependent transcriptional regulator, acetoin dehydrogenase operon transcriptional activator AcoR